MKNKKSTCKKVFISLLVFLSLIVTIALAYFIYLFSSYYRIEDNQTLEVNNFGLSNQIEKNFTYKVLTSNIGFGAYDDQFTFFMDDGYEDPEGKIKIYGKQSWATSKESVYTNILGLSSILSSFDSDFLLLQEVDDNATRSYHINEVELICKEFPEYSYTLANDYHSAFLFYPFTQPHGKTSANLMTLSKANVKDSVRRSLPLSDSIVSNLMDLDRCIMINHYPIKESSKEFTLINVHLSAYDKGGLIRKKQNNLLEKVLQEEHKKGNYLILGGDFNQVLIPEGPEYYVKKNGEIKPDWVAVFEGEFPGYKLYSSKYGDDGANLGTARNNTKPFNPDWTYTCSIDGFIVSDNINVHEVKTITSHAFKFSDHNPVFLSFSLN